MSKTKIAWCDDDTCKHYDNGTCTKEEIHINKRFGEMEQGQRAIHNTCVDYEV